MKIELPQERRLCLVGAGDMLKGFLARVGEHVGAFASVTVLSNQGLDLKWSTHEKADLGELCRSVGASLHWVRGNDFEEMSGLVAREGCNMGQVLGWSWLIPQSFLGHFDGRIFNLHSADLPKFRGGGGMSWQVLHGVEEVVISIHQMTPAFDAGAILFKERMAAEKPIYPRSLLAAKRRLYVEKVFPRLARTYAVDETLTLAPQDEEAAEYYPCLLTAENGFIDFTWNAESVEAFVRAFSYPYPGAIFSYREKRFHVRECRVVQSQGGHHPFAAGLVTNRTTEGVHVIVAGGVVCFKAMTDENGTAVGPEAFRLGERFSNSPEQLHAARLFRPRPSCG